MNEGNSTVKLSMSAALFLLSAVLVGSTLSIGCSSLMAVPSNLLNGLHRSAAVPTEPTQSDIEVAARDHELSELRSILDKMVESGELTRNAADLKFLEAKARLDNQIVQLEQQRDLAARQRLQQALSGLRNCYTNGLGYTSCF